MDNLLKELNGLVVYLERCAGESEILKEKFQGTDTTFGDSFYLADAVNYGQESAYQEAANKLKSFIGKYQSENKEPDYDNQAQDYVDDQLYADQPSAYD